ncbi:aprataxin and PNK-like factor isoform X2 [Electrophorus electricus]|uniref:aprataxin and PNK-like factor isoform X2 n=1 Tax=Electrophorus electricus TaxID=8005 RepID=UPI0015D0B9D3|nr:aprataxin and PNK-like factor isoform X2 [Electrophorus electricus]
MPAFELERVDGGDPVDVPKGSTVLGRGPYLGVSDKRVSRTHAVLENWDGQLRLKPTHTNPCFIQASLEALPQPLEKDQWHCLREGSTFSLLPGKYIYKVHVVSEEGTPRNSQGYEEEAEQEPPQPPRLCEETLAYTPQAKSAPSRSPTSTLTAHCKESRTCLSSPPSYSQVAGKASVSRTAEASTPCTPQRKRILPAWMTAATSAAPSPSLAKATKRAPAGSAPNPTRTKHATGPKQARARLPLSSEEEEGEEEQSEVVRMPRKRARRLRSDPDETQDQARVPRMSQESPGVREEAAVANTEEREEEEVKGRVGKRTQVPPRSRARDSPTAVEDSRNPQANEQPSQNRRQRSKVTESGDSTESKAQQRTRCPYGTSCYRKNPVHFMECSHPGDDDYEEEWGHEDGGDGDDSRPECPYGTDCYRKNHLHKKEYKHTKPPETMSVPGGDEDDGHDEDQYEDGFINDESEEEVGSDSDYVPESGDRGNEDVKQLQKEAKAFLRRKKN